MIRIACTNCKTVLTIDDAFAGGVCRCQHCGTIQTVPAAAKESATIGVGQAMGGSRQGYQNDARPGTGLDELAGVVVSSGLSSGRLTRQPASHPKGSNALMPLFIAAGALIVLLLLIIIIMAFNGGRSPHTAGTNAGQTPGGVTNASGTPAGTTAADTGPNFCGSKLNGSTVIYLLDCGAATNAYLGDLKDAVIRSVGSLSSDRKFEILFWSEDTDVTGYPDGTTAYATKDNVDAARAAIQDQPAFGQRNIGPALSAALDQHPDLIVVATGKGWDLDNNWVTDVMKIRGRSSIRIDTFNLGSNDSPPLKLLATKTGGSYRTLSKADLRGE